MTSNAQANSSHSLNSPYLTTMQAAKYLNLSHKTLEKFRVTGGGPDYRKHGRKVVYRASDLDAWSASRLARSTSETTARGWV